VGFGTTDFAGGHGWEGEFGDVGDFWAWRWGWDGGRVRDWWRASRLAPGKRELAARSSEGLRSSHEFGALVTVSLSTSCPVEVRCGQRTGKSVLRWWRVG
jgi:hypothetical protein